MNAMKDQNKSISKSEKDKQNIKFHITFQKSFFQINNTSKNFIAVCKSFKVYENQIYKYF